MVGSLLSTLVIAPGLVDTLVVVPGLVDTLVVAPGLVDTLVIAPGLVDASVALGIVGILVIAPGLVGWSITSVDYQVGCPSEECDKGGYPPTVLENTTSAYCTRIRRNQKSNR